MSAKRITMAGLIGCLLLGAAPAEADDLEPCNQILQSMRSASRRASFVILETRRTAGKLQQCLRVYNAHGLDYERCQRLKKEHQQQQDKMKDALAVVKSAMDKVKQSCFEPPPPAAGQ